MPDTKEYWVVAEYDTVRTYGGPEEGGWFVTEGTLRGILSVTSDEFEAYRIVTAYNQDVAKDYKSLDRPTAKTYKLGRRELKASVREQMCHSDWDVTDEDYEVRWDVPVHFPETRPHYC